jgi:peptidoglycan/xylan/chitin deacetylase (PgdA/CDA1 family)
MTSQHHPGAGPGRDLIGYAGNPPAVRWPGGARIAISLAVHYEEGSERSVGDGDDTAEWGSSRAWPAGTRDLAWESLFEYGSRVGFYRLMDVLAECGVRATFFACAVALERNRGAAALIRPAGHDVVAHGYRWEDVCLLGRDTERDHIARAVASIEETTGARPAGWYCRYGPSVHTRELLLEEGGFRFDCDSYADDLPYWAPVGGRRMLVVPCSLAASDGKFEHSYGSPRDFEDYLKDNFDRLYAEGATRPKMMSVGLHQRLAGRPARALAVKRFIEYAQGFPGTWFATRTEIADHWASQDAAAA